MDFDHGELLLSPSSEDKLEKGTCWERSSEKYALGSDDAWVSDIDRHLHEDTDGLLYRCNLIYRSS